MKHKKFSLFFLLSSLLLVAACGFHPLYGENKYTPVGAEDKLARIYIENIPDREGQFVRNELIDRFYRDGRPENPLYVLYVAPLTEHLIDLDITKSSDATRGQLRINTAIKLSDKRTGQIVLERNIQSITSYNILGSEFATRVSEQNTRENALKDVARQIELQLALYFKRIGSNLPNSPAMPYTR